MSESNAFDDAVRPTTWDDYVGQSRMKNRLEVAIKAAITQQRRLDDILLTWPPGTGKTTLARLIADRFHADFMSVTAPISIDRFLWLVEEFESGVVFIDEIHAASKAFQELLQPALEEDRVLLAPDGYEIDVSDIVFVAATTTEFSAKLLEPLVQRFEIQPAWEPYSLGDIAQILSDMAGRLGFSIDTETCTGLAGACGATPRLAKRLVKAARDLDAVGETVSAAAVLDHVGIDADGLGPEHLEYLRTLRQEGGKTGLATLANMLGKKTSAVQDLERLLAQQGLVRRSASGRMLTPAGRAKLGGGKKSRDAA